MSKNCIQVISYNFGNPPALPPTPKKFGKRYRGGTCVSENCMHFISNFFGPPALAPIPQKFGERHREGTCASENCEHFFYNFCNSSALSASATAGAPACQKIAYILFPKFWQSSSPSTHPVKIWRALAPRTPACQKIACIIFPTFLQFPGPSTHPVKIWRALPRGHLRVRKMHKLHTCYF